MASTPAQTILDTGADSSLSTLYPATLQSIPSVAGNATIYITNKEEFITNIITENGAGGADNEIQFNIGGRSSGDSGLTYDAATDSLSVANSIQVGSIRTDNLLHANGAVWDLGTNYGNSNVSIYLNSGTYTGNFVANNFSASTIAGNGTGLTHLTAANIVGSVANAVYAEAAGAASSINAANVIGTVANATYATSAGSAGSAATASTVTQAAQANITSLGNLTSLTVNGTAIAGLFSGSGANLSNIPVANLSGTVGFATTAGTVTTAAQPNITSVGTLSGLTVTSTIVGNISGSSDTAATVTTAAQPNITSVGTLANLTVGSSAPIYLYANGLANVTSTTASTNTTSGALKVAGGLGVAGNINAAKIHSTGNISGDLGLFGNGAEGSTFVNPVIIAKSTGTDYIQLAIVNSTDTGSSDYTAYGDNGDEFTAWIDLGFTGSNFADANYTITGSNDGYVFVQGLGGKGGNLVLATGSLGDNTHRDIVFATGGFLEENERMRLNHETLSLDISTAQAAISTTSGSFRVDGGAGITGNVYVGGKVDANTITLSGTGTAVNAGQGNILTNQVTGTYFNFLNGGFTARLTASGGATANYTLTLPSTAGSSGQVLTTDGSGVTSWSSPMVNTSGNYSVSGNIIPSANISYDLGSDTARFRDLYLSGTTIDLGGTAISADANGNISLGNVTFTSNSVGDIPVTNRYYVDPTRSAESYTPNGSQAMPFWTVAAAQSAITASGVNPQVEPIFITLLSNLTENITLSVGRIYLVGQSGSIHQPIVISGTITVEATSGTLSTNHFSLIGIEVVGPTDAKAIWVKGTYPTRLSVQDIWITANGNSGVGLYQDNTGTGTYTHGGPVKVSHNGTGDVYCFQIMKGTASFSQVETSGATQVGSVGSGGVLTFNDSELDASGDVVLETYGSGILVVTNSLIKNTGGNTCSGIKMNAIANVAGTVSIGQTAFDIQAGTGNAVWLDPNTTLDYLHGGFFAYAGTTFYPNTNTNLSADLFMSPLQSIATNVVQTRAVTLATLGSASSAGAGTKGFITNGNLVASGNFGAAVAGGGSNAVPVYSDGTSWRIG